MRKTKKLRNSMTVMSPTLLILFFGANPLRWLKRDRFTTILRLTESKFRFMLDETRTLNSACDDRLLSAEERDHSLMSSVNTVELERVDFAEPICPHVFNNVRMAVLSVKSPLAASSIRFLPVKVNRDKRKTTYYKKEYEMSGLGSFIKAVTFENLAFEQIDQDVLNYDVFSVVQTIAFRAVTAKKIEPNVFVNFKYA